MISTQRVDFVRAFASNIGSEITSNSKYGLREGALIYGMSVESDFLNSQCIKYKDN